MARKNKLYHFIYRIVNIKNGKYYIGMHSTDDLNDGYMGGGKKIKNSIKKHGKENHIKEILEFLPDRNSLAVREKEIVNKDLLSDIKCLNLMIGGECGGWINEEHKEKNIKAMSIAGNLKLKELWKDENWSLGLKNKRRGFWNDTERAEKMSAGLSFNGKKHREESIEKMKKADRTGKKNSQFGTCWITNGIENLKIKKESELPEGWKFGRTIKKV